MNQATLLLIDDSIEDLRSLISMLRSAGYRLIIATDGRDGVNRAMAFKPDLILLDVRMPTVDGFSACRLLKANPETALIPVIFLSAAGDVDDRLEGLRLGGVDYVSKPAVAEEVLLRVEIHLASIPLKAADRAQMQADVDLALESTQRPQQPDDTLAAAAVKLMESDLSQSLPIDELARKLGTNRRRLSDVFRARFGCTAKGWLRERRLMAAQEWLVTTEMTVQQISEELGYNSAANFATAFRHRFGLQPREFRAFQLRAAASRSDGDLRPEVPPLIAEQGPTSLGGGTAAGDGVGEQQRH